MLLEQPEYAKEPTDEHWMRLALKQADNAWQAGEVPVGAVLVRDQQVVGVGWNQCINQRDPSAHAEVVALRQAASQLDNYRLPDSTLYVTIEPCAMCVGAIVHARVRRLVFGAYEPKAGCVCSNPALLDSGHFNHRFAVTAGVLQGECSALISGFFAARRS